ncbi:hypothetical protein ACH5RR_000272 [Cinchona calisaya]|uniref:D-isomer specific 2-hydroxyacid dehydrogenase catalytic domain-containing protein n=1 Tax=Cinchona calisaya TaxID=153742 RepID=A0ABD3B0E1_9GENT
MSLEEFLITHADNTRAILCSSVVKKINASILRLLPSLRLVITPSAGLNHIDLDECRRRGISVANSSTIFSADVADLAVGLLIDFLRKISVGDRFVKSGLWPVKGHHHLATHLSVSTCPSIHTHDFVYSVLFQ